MTSFRVGELEVCGPWSDISLLRTVRSIVDDGSGRFSDCRLAAAGVHVVLNVHLRASAGVKPMKKKSLAESLCPDDVIMSSIRERAAGDEDEDAAWRDCRDGLSVLEAASDGREQLTWLVKRALLQVAIEIKDVSVTVNAFPQGRACKPVSFQIKIP